MASMHDAPDFSMEDVPDTSMDDVPDFVPLYQTGPLPPRMAAQLWATSLFLFDIYRGSDSDLVDELPPVALPHADRPFVDALVHRLEVIADRLAQGTADAEQICTCTADELVLHIVIDVAVSHASEDPHAAEWLAHLPIDAHYDGDFDRLHEVLFQDDDVLLLYDPALEGIEDPTGQRYVRERFVNLHSRDWFKPFGAHN